MGSHSAGRRVAAPGRWRLLNRILEGLAALLLVITAALAGWYTADVRNPTPDPALTAPYVDKNVKPGPAVPPVPPASLSVGTATANPATRTKKRTESPAHASATASATMSATTPIKKQSC